MGRRKKFKKKLVEQIKEDEKEALHQEQLKSRHHIEQDVVVVEKNNMIKFAVRTITAVLRLAAAISIFFLSLTGAAALLYPTTRAYLWGQCLVTWKEILQLLW